MRIQSCSTYFSFLDVKEKERLSTLSSFKCSKINPYIKFLFNTAHLHKLNTFTFFVLLKKLFFVFLDQGEKVIKLLYFSAVINFN